MMVPGGGAELLALLGSVLDDAPGLLVERSVRLRGGRVEDAGRFGVWLRADAPGALDRIGELLSIRCAPAAVRRAWRAQRSPVRQGIAFASGGETRLYLHRRDPRTSLNRYASLRWAPGGPVVRSAYETWWLPEAPDGLRPEDVVGASLRLAIRELVAHERLRRTSNFWLRRGRSGELEQLDLAWPWHPRAGELPGLREAAAAAGVGPAPWENLRVRHTAFPLGGATPSVTLYASAAYRGRLPRDERELAERIAEQSEATARAADASYAALPTSDGEGGLGGFYDGDVDAWRRILGPGMHYHAGSFESPDEEPERAFGRAVTELYPHLPRGGRIYDVGCGWGGPLGMIARDLGAVVLGVTESRSQYRHVASRGLPVRWGDAAELVPPGTFDCALLLESLSHFRDKRRLLGRLRPFVQRLVMRVNCQDVAPASQTFGGSMHVVSSGELRAIVEGTGYRITHWRDRRREGLPSVLVWQRRLRRFGTGGDGQLEVLRQWCERVAGDLDAWGGNNPLIEVVAERA